MTIEEAIKELKETWDYTTEETNHIKELMEKVVESSKWIPKKADPTCPECANPASKHPTERCDMVYGRRGWRQLGVYDG